jgi:pimeloyl-ACP methyl ester carboxylesterase
MNTKTRFQKILDFLKHSLIGVTVFVLVVGIIGTVYQTAMTEADQRNFSPPGNLIDVDGFKMHIHCEGAGSPTVILEAMSGGTSTYWGWIQPEVQKETRVCVYDRAGFGWSESDPEPQSLARTVHNLHALLVNANIDGPYVMVGHSLGGVYVRQFAADYPDEVAGVMLLDEANPQQFVKYPKLFTEGDNFISILNGIKSLNRIGVGHLYFALGGRMDFSELPEPQRSQMGAIWSTPKYFETQVAEIMAGHEIWADALNLKGLGDLPLMVVSRGMNLDYEWNTYQSELAALSTNSAHITVEGASHTDLVFNSNCAAEVSKAILQLVDAVRTGKRLGE